MSGSGKAVANLSLRIGLGQVLTNNVLSLFVGDEIDSSLDKIGREHGNDIGMIRDAVAVRLSPEERAVLEAKLRAPTTEQRQVFRARIVLLAAEERSTRSIARELGTMPRTVSGWRGRFAREGLAGLEDRPHPGPAPKYVRQRDRPAHSGAVG